MASKTIQTGTLTVSGEGRVQAKPDVVRVDVTVLTEAKTAEEALAQNAARASQVIEKLKALGIPSRGLQTLGINLTPLVDPKEGPDQNRIIGYRAEDTVAVTAPLELAGKVLDEAVGAGANQTYGLTFGLKDEGGAHAQALKAAAKAARADAEVVAGAMGVKLTGAKSVEVVDGGRPGLYRGLSRVGAGGTPVEGGELTVTAQVRVVFEYRID